MRKKVLNITGERIRAVFREALSPTFLFILFGAALLWYTSKLSYTYDTEMPLNIRIDGQRYRLTAVVTGRGSDILAQKLSLKSRLSFTLEELVSRPSRETAGALTITPVSLQKAINDKISDLVISQVVEAPEFVPAPVEAEAGQESGTAEPAEPQPAKPGAGRNRRAE